MRKAGGNVKLVNLNKRNIELLVMTKLATVSRSSPMRRTRSTATIPDRKIKTFDILDFVNKMKSEE